MTATVIPFSPEPPAAELPNWVPRDVAVYLAHTAQRRAIRDIARALDCHPSTVLRQVRRIESVRDDVLTDRALLRLAEGSGPEDLGEVATKALRALSPSDALLAVAPKLENAVIVRKSDPDGPLGIVPRDVAEALALMGWVDCATYAAVLRYRITAAGRSELARRLATDEGAAVDPDGSKGRRKPSRSELPLYLLARRRGRTGRSFLSAAALAAAERLREDAVLCDVTHPPGRGWEAVLAELSVEEDVSGQRRQAAARLAGALRHLGPALADVAWRCCCQDEGLERIERDLDWAQRSGKVVLRIALERLHLHYEATGGLDPMIG